MEFRIPEWGESERWGEKITHQSPTPVGVRLAHRDETGGWSVIEMVTVRLTLARVTWLYEQKRERPDGPPPRLGTTCDGGCGG